MCHWICVLQANKFSDHSGIAIVLHGNIPLMKPKLNPPCDENTVRWNNSETNEFQYILSAKVYELIHLENISVNTGENLDIITSSFTNILNDCATKVFGRSSKQQNEHKLLYTKSNKKRWFNSACHEARSKFKKCRNKFIKDKQNVEKKGRIFQCQM